MSDRGESPHISHHNLQLHPGYAQLLSWFSDPKAWIMDLSVGIVWSKDDETCMDMLLHCFISDIWGTDNIWQGWIIIQATNWPPTTPGRAQLLPWFLEKWAWTMYISSGVVVHAWWYMYRYAIPLFYEYYMRHRSQPIGAIQVTDYGITSNYTLNVLSCYPDF